MMRIEKTPSYHKMLQEINDNFGEYLEMGYSLEVYLLSKLYIEREKNYYLSKEIKYLNGKINER